MPLRRPSSPCSGRGALGSVVSHFGPPTAPSRTASDALQASSTSSVRATPCSSIEQPPISRSSKENSPSELSSSIAAATISGPIPSPGRTTMRGAELMRGGLYASAALAGNGLDVEPHVVEHQRRVRGGQDSFGEGGSQPLRQLSEN